MTASAAERSDPTAALRFDPDAQVDPWRVVVLPPAGPAIELSLGVSADGAVTLVRRDGEGAAVVHPYDPALRAFSALVALAGGAA